MGLDITAYEKVVLAADQTQDRGDHQRRVWAEPQWAHVIDDLAPGLYDCSGETFRLPSQPYSSYNRWRERLCWAALEIAPEDVWRDFERFEDKPFVELINFTDCSGVIGPKLAEKLRNDFIQHAHLLRYLPIYDEWTHVFAIAARGGIVVFD